MAIKQFLLPDLGEGLPDGDLVRWLVKPGDTVAVNDSIAEVETVKAAVELPSPYAGVVRELLAAEGETVPVGKAIIAIETPGDAAAPAPAEGAPPQQAGDAPMTLVGYGPREQTPSRRRRTGPAAAQAPAIDPAPGGSAQSAGPDTNGHARALAKPPVRKLAKDLGVDLATVEPTGPNGTVTRDDIRAAAPRVAGYVASGDLQPATGDQTHHSGQTRIPVKGVRKHTAAAMVSSAFTAPHVTEFVTIDVSATMALRDRVAARREFADVKVTPLLFVAKAVLLACARTPELNASWESGPDGDEIVLHGGVNLGIAAATERGLIVPNVKGADQLSLLELARAVGELTDTARAGRTTPADLAGGTFTITNVGVFGVDTGTPILNPGESGILAVGAINRRPWVVQDETGERIEARWVTQLGLSFDHRVVDGEQGSRFLMDVAQTLADPGLAML